MKSEQFDKKLVDFIVSRAVHVLAPNRIILFGSRARGDARTHSDYDIAFELSSETLYKDWSAFCVDIHENSPTLLSLDLVNINDIDDNFKEKIYSEGVTLYEKKS